MKAFRFLIPFLFLLIALASQAATVTNTFQVTSSNFVPSFKACANPVPGPIDPVKLAFSITFDNSTTVTDSTANITLIYSNVPNSGTLVYSYNKFVDELGVGTMSPAGAVTDGVNNFALAIKDVSTNPTVTEVGYSLGGPNKPCIWFGGNFALTTGSPWTHLKLPVIGLRLGQTVRLNFVAGPVPVPGPGPCEARLNIYDAANNLIASQSVSPSGNVAFDYGFRSAIANRASGRKELRPEVILMPPVIPGTPAAGDCPGQATAEVYDDLTKSTSLIVSERDPGPANLPAVQFGPVGVGFLQTVRLNVVADPPSPCAATLSFTDTQGTPIGTPSRVTLTGGNATFIDLRGTAIPSDSGHGEVMAVFEQTSDPAQGTCIPSVEVFDQLTGGTQVLIAPERDPGPIQ